MDPVNAALADPAKRESAQRRLASFLRPNIETGCIEWTGKATAHGGYGAMTAGRGYKIRAHRLAWALRHGPIPSGKIVCHKCDNPKCCNVLHLFLGTKADNMDDKMRKGRGSAPPMHLGEKHPKATIPDADFPAIKASKETLHVLAARYGVSTMTIWRIRKGKTRHAHIRKGTSAHQGV